MISFPVIRVVTKLLIPYIVLFALYVQFHGDFGPGGGFQAGVILASALILYGLVFGLAAAKKVAPPEVIEKLMALGVVVYAGDDCSNPNKDKLIVGFAYIKVKNLLGPPDYPKRYVDGYLVCNAFDSNDSRGGGGAYGIDGPIPNLVE